MNNPTITRAPKDTEAAIIGPEPSWLPDWESFGADSDPELVASSFKGLLIFMCLLVGFLVGIDGGFFIGIVGLTVAFLANEGALDLSTALLGFNVGIDFDFTLGLVVAAGLEVGLIVGLLVGFTEGFREGFLIGVNVGFLLGFIVGDVVGVALGLSEGF